MSVGEQKRRRSDQFTFKRFQIDQTGCAMRISSDATIFGAYIAVDNAKTILDIGTGTGLLALMVAQRAHPEARIDAVEISPLAFTRAKDNVASSPFADMIHPVHQSIQEFALQSQKRYELILSNPPFYQNDLPLSAKGTANIARHSHENGLDFAAMLAAVEQLLDDDGIFWVLLPAAESATFSALASAAGLHEKERLCIRHSSSDPINRMISAYSRRVTKLETHELVRHNENGSPTCELKELLSPYMLHY
jgi:tRNA1Val (adenine37-N6)-methyltransferase